MGQEEADDEKAKRRVSVNKYITLQKNDLILKGAMVPTEQVPYFYLKTEVETQRETLTVY